MLCLPLPILICHPIWPVTKVRSCSRTSHRPRCQLCHQCWNHCLQRWQPGHQSCGETDWQADGKGPFRRLQAPGKTRQRSGEIRQVASNLPRSLRNALKPNIIVSHQIEFNLKIIFMWKHLIFMHFFTSAPWFCSDWDHINQNFFLLKVIYTLLSTCYWYAVRLN